MAVDYTKTKEGDYNAAELAAEINGSTAITPSCLSVTGNGTTLIVEMAAALSAEEETELDAIILSHTLPPKVIDQSTLKFADNLGGKLQVHASGKPEFDGGETFVIWAGCGDDYLPPEGGTALEEGGDLWQKPMEETIGEGPLMTFNMNYNGDGPHVVTKDVRFDPRHGRVWIHEAYLKFEGGGTPDCISADIMCPATPIQNVANLDLIIEDDWIKYSPGGPGTGTHGFAGTPSLMPRTFSKDGDWDFDGVNLTPNFTGTGLYRMPAIDQIAHRYINRVPLYGSASTYFMLTSDETAELPVAQGYYVRINVYNNSNSDWSLSCIMEIYRERTIDP